MKAVLLFLVLSAVGADADPVQKAKDLYRAGGESYRQGQYEVAINAFEAAKALTPAPPVIFSLAQAYRLQYFTDGDPAKLEKAITNYREYISRDPDGRRTGHAARHIAALEPIQARLARVADQLPEEKDDSPPVARLIVSSRVEGAIARVDDGEPVPIPVALDVTPGPQEVRVEAPQFKPRTVRTFGVEGSVVPLNVELEEVPGQLLVRAPQGAKITLDDRPLDVRPGAPADVRAGPHVLAVVANGRTPFVRALEIGRGQAMSVDAQLDVTGQRIAAYGMFVGAGVLAAGAGVSLGLAFDRQSQARDILDANGTRSLDPEEATEHERLVSSRDRYGRLAGVGFGLAAAAALGGAAMWIFDTPSASGGAQLVPALGPGKVGAALELGF